MLTSKPSESFQPKAMWVIRDPAQASALLQGDRRHYLNLLAVPDSASGLARRLKKPRQQVNYHLRALEQAGFLRQVAKRQARNCIERVVQATAYRYVISPEVLAELGNDPAEAVDRFSSAYLISLAGRTIRELGEIRELAQTAGQSIATLSMDADIRFADAADRNRFAEELAAAFAGLIQKYHRPESPKGRSFRFVVGGYPALKPKDPDAGHVNIDPTEEDHE